MTKICKDARDFHNTDRLDRQITDLEMKQAQNSCSVRVTRKVLWWLVLKSNAHHYVSHKAKPSRQVIIAPRVLHTTRQMTLAAQGIMDMFSSRPLYIIVGNLYDLEVCVLKHRKIAQTVKPPNVIYDINVEDGKTSPTRLLRKMSFSTAKLWRSKALKKDWTCVPYFVRRRSPQRIR